MCPGSEGPSSELPRHQLGEWQHWHSPRTAAFVFDVEHLNVCRVSACSTYAVDISIRPVSDVRRALGSKARPRSREAREPRHISVWPVASHTRTLPVIAIIGAQVPREPVPAPLGRRARPPGCVAGYQDRSIQSDRLLQVTPDHLRQAKASKLPRALPRRAAPAPNVVQPVRPSELADAGEHRARRYPVATRKLSHLRARRQRLLDNPRLVTLRPAPPPPPI